MTPPLEKAGDGSVTHEVFNALVDAVEAGSGGSSLPSQWTVDPATGQFTINFDDDSQSIEALLVNYVGDPTDYIPLFAVGGTGGSGREVLYMDSGGNLDFYFRDSSGVKADFWRTDPSNHKVVSIGVDTFLVSDSGSGSLILADYDQKYLGLAASDSTLAFFGGAGVTKRTGVAVDAAGIHAALVAYGLISA